jgi:magnesium-transporting ATPase (P-type)
MGIKNLFRKYLNEILLLIIIGYLYSKEPGFIIEIDKNGILHYSTELMSSGSNDFDIFIGWNYITNILIILTCIINIITNIFTKKKRHYYYIAYLIIFMLQGLIIFSINLDISIMDSVEYGDKYVLKWLLIYIIGFIIININRIIIKICVNNGEDK